MRLSYLGFEVADFDSWARYCELYGLGVRREDDRLLVHWDEQDRRLMLTQGTADDVSFVGIEATERGEFEMLVGRLEELAIPTSTLSDSECQTRGAEMGVAFSDPDGTRFELVFGMKQAATPFKSGYIEHGFVSGDMGFGHATLNCSSLERTVEFWTSIGARVSDYIDIKIGSDPINLTFLRFNTRHHSLAYVQGPFPPLGKRMNHFEFQVVSIEDVGRTYERVKHSNFPIAANLGQHPNDKGISFYSVSPSGFMMEIGCNCITVDDAEWEVGHLDHLSSWGHELQGGPA